jgi:hypothetical protein
MTGESERLTITFFGERFAAVSLLFYLYSSRFIVRNLFNKKRKS